MADFTIIHLPSVTREIPYLCFPFLTKYMKKFLLFLICGLALSSLQAQRPYYRPNVHQFDLQLGAATLIKADYYKLGVSPLNGLRYRYHFNKSSDLRVGAFYRTQYFKQTDCGECVNQASAPVRHTYADLKLGYERKFALRKSQLYGGADVILSEFFQTEFLDQGKTKNTYPQMGIGVFLGYRYFTSENWSFAVENEIHIVNTFKGSNVTQVQDLGGNFLQASLSYHFKQMHKSCACGKPGS